MWAAWTLAAGLTAALVVMLAVWLIARGRVVGEREAVRRLLSDYRTLLQDLGAVIWEFDLASERVTFVSDSAVQVLGYDLDAWRRHDRLWFEKTHPDDRDRMVEALHALRQDAGLRRLELRMLAADGRVVWLETALIAFRGHSGERKVRGVTFDTSAHKHSEQTLRRLLSLYTAIVESTADGILVVDLAGKITSTNRKFGEMWNLPAEVLQSGEDDRALAVVLDQLVDPEGFLSKVRELYAHREAASFDVLQFKDGRVFERYSQPQRIDGECVGRVWSFRDVTERARAERALRASEEQLRQAHKMEAVGRLAGGVAHDFNNILTAILGNLGLLLDDSRTPTIARQRLEDIEQAAERAASLTRQLLAFSRKQMFELEVVDLNRVLADMRSLLMPILGENIELEIRRSPQTCLVRVDRSQIEQVILNLAINGRDAMPRGGRLEMTTSVHERESPSEREPSGSRRWVTLTVADNGVGMDEDTRLHLFEPFFTTKERGKGTGLGLATVYGIVRQSGGQVRVHSEPGRGSTFHVDLPWVEEHQRHRREDPVPQAALDGTETVLVTEDEDQVLRLMSASLRRFGYHVLEAHRGVHAIAAAAAFPGTIHLLVTDVVMPGMGGRELAERLTAVRPSLRVLFVSGYTDEDVVHRGVVDPKVAFLQKPFTMVALARKVRETLDIPPPAK